MIRYHLVLPEGEVIVSVAATDGNAAAEIQYTGDSEAIEALQEELPYAYGAFGHLIGSLTTPIDLDAAMHSEVMQDYQPELLEGGELVQRYNPNIPDGTVT